MMTKLWDFFENLDEYVYAADAATCDMVFMNRRARELCGVWENEGINDRKCYEVLRHLSSPCKGCNNPELKQGEFTEWECDDKQTGKTLLHRATLIEDDGRLYRVDMASEVRTEKENEQPLITNEHSEFVNQALRAALTQSDPEKSIEVFLEHIGKALGGERTFVFEKNENGNDDNTYEWVAEGVTPQKENLQDVPAEVCASWYSAFADDRPIIIKNINNFRDTDPLQYELLRRQDISSIVVVPMYDGDDLIGFYGVDNPSGRYADNARDVLQTVAYYIVASIKRRNLIRRLKSEEIKRTAYLMQQEMSQTLARQIQENLDMVNNIIGSGLWYMEFDRKGEMTKVFWSETFRKMLGFDDTGDFPNILKSWSDRIHPDDRESIMHTFWGAIAGRCEYNVKYRLMKKSGEYNWFRMHGRIDKHENGNPRLFLGIFINITREQQEQQALEDAYTAANRANAAKSEFMANMSHDIRTPLNAIIGMTAIAATNLDDPEKVDRCLSEIMVSSRHLLGLINEVLDMNKIESGKVSLNIEEFDLADLVDNFISISRPLIAGKKHELIVDIHDLRHERVCGDSERIQQCLMNFMSNAVKYTPDGGTIHFSLSEKVTNRPKRGCYEFVFEDNGIGMSEEFFPQIFEPFARAKDKRALSQQGTGLGMPITKNIIQMMNGDIKVESELNKGTKFTATIFLEISDDDGAALEELAGMSVLVADDNKLSCYNTCRILNELGMNSEWVLTDSEAVDLTVERSRSGNAFYAVILGHQMPEMNGAKAAKKIRDALGEDSPVIIISAYDWAEIEQQAREAGADAFINKPIFRSRMAYVFRKIVGNEQDEVPNDTLDEFKKKDFSDKRVLVVEDNEINAEIAMEILGMTGLSLEHVWNGKEALDRLNDAEDGYFDLVFMDIQMPVMDGYEATVMIRSQEREYLKKLPIVAMSANAFAEDVQHSKASGMNDHVAKPLDFNRLMSVLNKWLYR